MSWLLRFRFINSSQLGNVNKHYIHDDFIKWKHFPRYWPFVRGIHRWPVNSPHKGQWRGALMFSLIYAWIIGWINTREAGDLRTAGRECVCVGGVRWASCGCWGWWMSFKVVSSYMPVKPLHFKPWGPYFYSHIGWVITSITKCGIKLSSIHKLQRLNRWTLGMDEVFHPTLYWVYDYLSMQGINIIHFDKKEVPWNNNYDENCTVVDHIFRNETGIQMLPLWCYFPQWSDI